MNTSVSARLVRFTEENMQVELSDGRSLVVPLAWFPRLQRSTPEQRERAARYADQMIFEGFVPGT